MAEYIDWFKAIGVFIKDNKWLVLLALGSIGSITTNIGQLFGYQEIETELVQTQNQVAETARHYMKPTKVIVTGGCNCKSLYFNHLKDDH